MHHQVSVHSCLGGSLLVRHIHPAAQYGIDEVAHQAEVLAALG
jgi:hypothetical protein